MTESAEGGAIQATVTVQVRDGGGWTRWYGETQAEPGSVPKANLTGHRSTEIWPPGGLGERCPGQRRGQERGSWAGECVQGLPSRCCLNTEGEAAWAEQAEWAEQGAG